MFAVTCPLIPVGSEIGTISEGDGCAMDAQRMEPGALEKMLRAALQDASFSRRRFLQLGGISIIGMSVVGARLASEAAGPVLYMEQATGIVIGDPTKCVGCRRCELACTEFNDGRAAPSAARVKVARNLNFGPKGVQAGQRGQGNWGDGLVVQDLCKQCRHPVPCATACPQGAIVAKPPTNARVVDAELCIGCKFCLYACPWEMLSFDRETGKAVKCSLCDGKPKCVEACPAESLRYVSWRDLTRQIPRRASADKRSRTAAGNRSGNQKHA
jgi:Fe-S-cluster-containing dehydrogenase component